MVPSLGVLPMMWSLRFEFEALLTIDTRFCHGGVSKVFDNHDVNITKSTRDQYMKTRIPPSGGSL